MKTVSSVVLLAALVGCATANTQQEVDSSAAMYYGSHACLKAGYIDQDTAAQGIALSTSAIHRSESERVRARIRDFEARNPSPQRAMCDELALRIKVVHAQQAQESNRPAPAQASVPRNTVCNQAFGQMYCSTY